MYILLNDGTFVRYTLEACMETCARLSWWVLLMNRDKDYWKAVNDVLMLLLISVNLAYDFLGLVTQLSE